MSGMLLAEPVAATRYDNQIQITVAQKLAAKNQFRDVQSSTQDGIVTLTGTVEYPKLRPGYLQTACTVPANRVASTFQSSSSGPSPGSIAIFASSEG